jgi:hypothetical protein
MSSLKTDEMYMLWQGNMIMALTVMENILMEAQAVEQQIMVLKFTAMNWQSLC